MKDTTMEKKDWKERFDKKFSQIDGSWDYGDNKNILSSRKNGKRCGLKDIKKFIQEEKSQSYRDGVKEGRKEGIEECIKLSDEIEEGKDTTLGEWKAFKQFRNTLRDKLESLTNQSEDNEKTESIKKNI